MTENIEWKSLYQQEPIEDIYFKFVCFYMAQNELFDRRLTDLRSPHDKTEAYITGIARRWSNWYSKKSYDWIREYIYKKTKSPFDSSRWNRQKQNNYSAQGWIDIYEYFKNENDEIILDMEKDFRKRPLDLEKIL